MRRHECAFIWGPMKGGGHANGVLNCINNNDPQSGPDRLHTFTVAFMRSLCEKHGIKVDWDEPLHSIYQSSAKSIRIDAGDGQRDDVNTQCLQDISKI